MHLSTVTAPRAAFDWRRYAYVSHRRVYPWLDAIVRIHAVVLPAHQYTIVYTCMADHRNHVTLSSGGCHTRTASIGSERHVTCESILKFFQQKYC